MKNFYSKEEFFSTLAGRAKREYSRVRMEKPCLFPISFMRKKIRDSHFHRNFGYTEAHLLEAKGDFSRAFVSHRGLRSQKWSHFLSIYDELILELKTRFGKKIHILEIGIQNGGSLEIWRKVFGKEAEILGIDIDPRCALLDVDANVKIGSATDAIFIAEIMSKLKYVDFVVDDGSHHSIQQRKSFELLFPYLSNKGIYVIEDLEHSYYWSKHGGYLRNGAIMQRTKRLLDAINKVYFRLPVLKSFNIDTNLVKSVKVMQGILIIEKDERVKTSIAISGRRSSITQFHS